MRASRAANVADHAEAICALAAGGDQSARFAASRNAPGCWRRAQRRRSSIRAGFRRLCRRWSRGYWRLGGDLWRSSRHRSRLWVTDLFVAVPLRNVDRRYLRLLRPDGGMTSSQIDSWLGGSSCGSKGSQGDIPAANCGFDHDCTRQRPDQHHRSSLRGEQRQSRVSVNTGWKSGVKVTLPSTGAASAQPNHVARKETAENDEHFRCRECVADADARAFAP